MKWTKLENTSPSQAAGAFLDEVGNWQSTETDYAGYDWKIVKLDGRRGWELWATLGDWQSEDRRVPELVGTYTRLTDAKRFAGKSVRDDDCDFEAHGSRWNWECDGA